MSEQACLHVLTRLKAYASLIKYHTNCLVHCRCVSRGFNAAEAAPAPAPACASGHESVLWRHCDSRHYVQHTASLTSEKRFTCTWHPEAVVPLLSFPRNRVCWHTKCLLLCPLSNIHCGNKQILVRLTHLLCCIATRCIAICTSRIIAT